MSECAKNNCSHIRGKGDEHRAYASAAVGLLCCLFKSKQAQFLQLLSPQSDQPKVHDHAYEASALCGVPVYLLTLCCDEPHEHLVVKIAVNLCVTFNYGVYCRVCYSLQCCETLGWVTGRASGL